MSNSILRFLTIPDPILVGSFDTSTPNTSIVGLEQPSYRSKSHFHGTSGFMLYLPETEEYLGVGHIHREQKWSKNVDAHFGHHYTHAFFTIKKVVEETVTKEAEEEEQQFWSSSSQSLPYELTRVSQEFLFPSKVKPNDADIIQFASGLEWVYSRSTNTQTTATSTSTIKNRQKNCHFLWYQ